VKRNTQQKWVDELSLIKVEGKNEDDKKIFYTAYYHTLTSPTIWTEADGKYMGFDHTVRDTPSHMKNVYTDLSIWDTHRSQFPWLLFTNPSLMRDVSNSLLLMYQQTGGLPRWPIGYVQTGCMFGSYGDTVLADQITKHEYTNDTFNTTLAMDACRFVSNNMQSHDSR
jgi:putative alpha-1,2-mannosidase